MDTCRGKRCFCNRIVCVAKQTTKPRLLQSSTQLFPHVNQVFRLWVLKLHEATCLSQNIKLTIELILCHGGTHNLNDTTHIKTWDLQTNTNSQSSPIPLNFVLLILSHFCCLLALMVDLLHMRIEVMRMKMEVVCKQWFNLNKAWEVMVERKRRRRRGRVRWLGNQLSRASIICNTKKTLLQYGSIWLSFIVSHIITQWIEGPLMPSLRREQILGSNLRCNHFH